MANLFLCIQTSLNLPALVEQCYLNYEAAAALLRVTQSKKDRREVQRLWRIYTYVRFVTGCEMPPRPPKNECLIFPADYITLERMVQRG